MLLDDQSAVNCTVSVGRVGFRCCLRAGGQWLDDLTCAFREDVTKRGGARAMGGRLRAWNECLAIAAEGNDTLADALADAGQLCFAAPGSTTEAQEGLRVFLLALGALAFLACVGLLIWIITSIVREADVLRARREAGSPSSHAEAKTGAESTPLFAEAERDEETWHEKESDSLRRR